MKSKFLLLLLLNVLLGFALFAQTPDLSPWEDTYGNEWIDYSKKYVRVGITEDGMYKIPLAALRSRIGDELTGDNVQGWFRGKQIALLIDDENNVIFYGRRNDGAWDGLMFRNAAGDQIDPSQRLNTHDSFFSEQGAHFFTWAKPHELGNLMRIQTISAEQSDGTPVETHHIETFIKTNGNFNGGTGALADRRFPRPFSGVTDLAIPTLNNSFFTSANAFIWLRQTNAALDETVNLKNFVEGTERNVTIEFSIHGDGPGSRQVEVYAASTPADINNNGNRVFTRTISGYAGIKESSVLTTGTNVSESGTIHLKFKSNTSVDNSLTGRNRYGVSYFRIDYPQSLTFSGLNEKKYFFEKGVSGEQNISIPGVPNDIIAFNISDKDNPAMLDGTISGQTLELGVAREVDNALSIQLISSSSIPQPQHIQDVKFDLLYSSKTRAAIANVRPEPCDYDYLVITHISSDDKNVKDGAVAYANYRTDADGGGHNTLVISTRTIYDQFNYGEASPIAIGRFVNYMIQCGVRTKHNVLLVGHGVGQPDNIIRELPNDVPTYGNPGSDVLLVSGLSNSPTYSLDIPAIPIGRIPAFTSSQVTNYRDKVKEYERQSREASSAPAGDLDWRRNVLNIIGYKVKSETTINPTHGVTNYKYFVNEANGQMDDDYGPWEVSEVSNEHLVPNTGNTPRSLAPIGDYINDGVGVIGYYGHGDFEGTTYNIGTPKTLYNESVRYPFVYITGCGVGDAYYSHSTQYIASDWIVVPNKGAIAFMANTYLAYTTTAAKYMKLLYKQIFDHSDATRQTLGNMQVTMAKLFILGESGSRISAASAEERANIHQTALFGDPAVRILLLSNVALPVNYKSFDAREGENNQVYVTWETTSEVNNDFFIVERSTDGKTFYELGRVNASTDDLPVKSYRFTDSSPVAGNNYYRLKQWDRATDNSEQQYAYSNIVSVNIKSRLTHVYPNPTSDRMVISSSHFDPRGEWKLIDHSGRSVLSGKGKNIDLKTVSAGSYVLIIYNSKGEKESHQIVKN